MQLNYSDAWNHTNATSSVEPCTTIDIVLNAYYVPFIYGTTFVLGSSLNTVAIVVYVFAMKEWNRSNIFLFNLLLADLLYIFNLPFLVSVYMNNGVWYYGPLYCKIMRYLYHANLYTSILFLSCVSMDRYLLIAHPVKSAQLFKKWHAVLISMLIWVIVTLELLPMFFLITVEGISNSTELKCLDYASSGDVGTTFIFSMTVTFTGFLIPFGILVYSYVLVVRVLKDMQQRLKKTSEKAGKPLTLIVFAMVLFSASFFPYHVMRNARIATRMFYEPTSCPLIICRVLYNITRPLSSLNSCLNPVFYFLVGDSFRDKLLFFFKRKPKNKKPESITSVSTPAEPI
ncbi:Succinate receptor 1 [Acipenser ruthenus]|uniref:Succinate receptor 1 n=1 Tax=Acipenser ruthenus TaxID=7906 RepID=A0A444TWY2_ACIRT|nr:Succinate receptor 1 [Acipenser ruthenus]